jgi:subtilase family serine protease
MRLQKIAGALLFAVLVVGGCDSNPAGPDTVPIPEPIPEPSPGPSLGQADLVISNINFSPGSPRVGEEITFWVFVRNDGDAQAAASMLRFQVGGESDPPETSVPALGPGEEYRHERKVTLDVAQNYSATATADARSHVAESNEGNNALTKDFSVQPAEAPVPGQPDLVIRLINFSPGAPRAGEEITFWVFVRNDGDAQAGISTLRFQVGGETFPPESPVPALDPGQEYRHERKVTLGVAQNYLATATADALNEVAESDEGNNVLTRSFTVEPAPDLVIRLINFSPGAPKAGDEITFWVFVRNDGDAQAGASTLRFKVGGETFPPETPVPALDPGEEYRYERKVTLGVAQNYLATATADALNEVVESDESNNILTRNFTVAP